MHRASAILILCCCLLGAAEPSTPATAIWPLPRPDWLRQSVLPGGLVIRRVLPALPAHLAHLAPGDAVAMVATLAPCSQAELGLAVRLAALYGDDSGEILREGATKQIHVTTFMSRARWGFDVNEPDCPAPAGLDAARAAAWPSLPLRVRLVAARVAADQAKPDHAWLDALIDLAGTAALPEGPGRTGEAAAMPEPYLERVAAWWRLRADGSAKPVDDADEALFRAAHIPWPTDPAPAAGTIATGDAEVDRLFLALAKGGQSQPGELSRLADRMVENGIPQVPGAGGAYLGQCLAAIADPDRHGGWPFRSALIWEKGPRAKVVADLGAWATREPAFAGLAALGCVGPAVMDGDAAALSAALATLQRTSPWLARSALTIGAHAARMHGKLPWLIPTLLAGPPELLSPALRGRLDYLGRHPGGNLDQLLSTDGPGIIDRLSDTWTQHAAWSRQLAQGTALSLKLNGLLWDLATSPDGLDAEACLPLARLQLLANGLAGTAHWQSDTIAAALARGGVSADAVPWQQTAIAQLEGSNRPDQSRAASLADYAKRLVLYRSGQAYSDGAEKAMVAQPRSEAPGRSTGGEIAGRKTGAWTTTDSGGAIVQILGYRSGEPAGRWTLRAPGGALRWDGWLLKQARVGWWTIATADGGTACGWYDGEEGGSRIGWWTLRAKDGAIRAEGPCQAGRPVAPWRARQGDGPLLPIDAASVVLPVDPPLPDAKPATVSDF